MTRHTTKNGVTLLVEIPESESVESAILKACRGNDRIAQVMHYFLYAASKEARDKDLKGCNVVTVSRTHERILEFLRHRPARKSLIRYLDTLNDWQLVTSETYKRNFAVNLEALQNAINTPPAPRKRLYEKGCNNKKVTTLQPFDENSQERVRELEEKVVTLQHNVDKLQRELCNVTTFCGQITTLQRDFEARLERLQDRFFSPTKVTKDITSITEEKEIVSSLDAMHTPPLFFEHPIATEALEPEAENENVAVEPPVEQTPQSKKQGAKRSTRPVERSAKVVTLKTPKAVLSPEGQTVYERWQEALDRRFPAGPALIEAANTLAEYHPTVDDLRACRGWCFTSNAAWYRDKLHGKVTLTDIVKNWEGWQSAQASQSKPPQGTPPGGQPRPSAALSPEQVQRNRERNKLKIAENRRIEEEKRSLLKVAV